MQLHPYIKVTAHSMEPSQTTPNFIANNNSERMKDFCCEYGLCISSTFYIHKETKKVTWHSPDKKTKKKLDYMLCEPWLRQYMMDCCVMNSIYFDSDHVLLVAKLRTPYTKQGRFRPRSLQNAAKFEPDLKSLKNKMIATKLNNDVTNSLNTLEEKHEVNEIVEGLTETLKQSAARIIPSKSKNIFNNIWKSDQGLNICYDQMHIVSKFGTTTAE